MKVFNNNNVSPTKVIISNDLSRGCFTSGILCPGDALPRGHFVSWRFRPGNTSPQKFHATGLLRLVDASSRGSSPRERLTLGMPCHRELRLGDATSRGCFALGNFALRVLCRQVATPRRCFVSGMSRLGEALPWGCHDTGELHHGDISSWDVLIDCQGIVRGFSLFWGIVREL